MALNLPDFGTWLLRSVWRDSNLSKGPVSVIERLNAARPLQDADKDTLLGAVLAVGPSLQLALQMLLELLPEDESRERLGEVLCPTLGQLHRILTDTLLSFEPGGRDHVIQSDKRHYFETSPGDFLQAPIPTASRRPRTPQRPSTSRDPSSTASQARGVSPRPDSAPSNIRSRPTWTPAERFPTVDITPSTPMRAHTYTPAPRDRSRDPAADLALVKDLRAEMRVNAAIQVAVDSLEFAEGQLKIVKEVNQLSGGSFDLLHRHFYEGYNRILFRALELERREFDSPPYAASLVDGSVAAEMEPEPEPQLSVTFESPVALPPLPPLSPSQTRSPARRGPETRPQPIRRNTTQGILEHNVHSLGQRLKVKRRLSLAEELALACDGDSEDESGSGGSSGGSEAEQEALNGEVEDQAQSSSDSESSQEESEEDDSEEEEGAVESDSGSDSDDSSSGDDGSDEEGARSAGPPRTRVILDSKKGASVRVLKKLETRVAVISPPTSPERPTGVVMSPENLKAKS